MPTNYNLIHDRIHHDLTFLQVEPAGDTSPQPSPLKGEGATEPPLVIVLHGLRSIKENYLKTSYRFAQRGFRAVAMDLRQHGERDHAGDRDAHLEAAYVPTMLAIIEKSVADIGAVIDHFGAAKAAIHGVSLGGIITFAALLAEPRLTVAAVAMGTPDWAGMLKTIGLTPEHPQFAFIEAASPLARATAIAPRPLLMLHGTVDETVPVNGVRKLRQKLAPLYAETPERLELVEYEELGHHYTDDMIHRSVDWVEHFL